MSCSAAGSSRATADGWRRGWPNGWRRWPRRRRSPWWTRLRSSVLRSSAWTSWTRQRARRSARAASSRRRWLMAELRFEGATRVYPGSELPALDGLDLDIQDGELMVLVG